MFNILHLCRFMRCRSATVGSARTVRVQLSMSPSLFPHLGWIAARAHTGWIGPIGTPRKIGKMCAFLLIFPVHGKDGLRWPQIGPGGFLFLLIQTLPTFWAERMWILKTCIFVDFLDTKFLDFQVPRWSPNSQSTTKVRQRQCWASHKERQIISLGTLQGDTWQSAFK